MILTQTQAPKVNTPIAGRDNTFSIYWQYWLAGLWQLIQTLLNGVRPIIRISTDTTLTKSDSAGILRQMIFVSNGAVLTLPSVAVVADAVAQEGRSYFIFNEGPGLAHIVGTVNGDPLGFDLPNAYDFVEITGNSIDWYVTETN